MLGPLLTFNVLAVTVAFLPVVDILPDVPDVDKYSALDHPVFPDEVFILFHPFELSNISTLSPLYNFVITE